MSDFKNYQSSTIIHQPSVKVCGLTQLSQIQELINLEVDFLGFIFYEKSPRFVLNHLSLEEISQINHSGKVGVFVNETIENIVEISTKSKLNFVQLHGDETSDFILELRQKLPSEIEIIKVIRIGNQSVEELGILINAYRLSSIAYYLFDTDSKAFGGTGKTFDWQVLNELNLEKLYFLSGGVSLENISEIEKINKKPFALDVNSKFEISAGVKDLEKVKNLKNEI